MASLSSLRADLERYESSKADYESKREIAIKERDLAKKRKDKIKSINNNLKRDFDNDVRNTNRNADDTSREIEDGIIGITTPVNIDNAIQDDKELSVENDTNLGAAITELDTEYNELQAYYDLRVTRISEYNSKISSLNWSILCTEKEIWEEEAKEAAEEAAKQLSKIFS